MNFSATKKAFSRFMGSRHILLWMVLTGVTLVFTAFINPGKEPRTQPYQLGDVVERDVKASMEFFIEDTDATSGNRKQAAASILSVYDMDDLMVKKITRKTTLAFENLRAVLEAPEPSDPAQAHKRAWELKGEFERIMGIKASNGAYKLLEERGFAPRIAELINEIFEKVLDNGVVGNKEVLLGEEEKGIVLRDLNSKTENVARNLKRFYGLDQARTMVRIVGQPLLTDIDYNTRNLIVDFVQRLIQPNILLNRTETAEREKRALAQIKPVLYKIKQGEMILREGDRVSLKQLRILSDLKKQTKSHNFLARTAGAGMIILCLLLTSYFVHIHGEEIVLRERNRNILFFAFVLIPFLFLARAVALLPLSLGTGLTPSFSAATLFYGVPLAAAPMTICLFLSLRTAVPYALLTALFSAILFNSRLEVFIFFLLSGTMGAYWMQDCRERKVFIKAGLKLGLLNMFLVLAVNIYTGNLVYERLPWDLTLGFLGGFGAGIITAGIAPLVELIFNFTTDIKLLELANLDQTLLRRLMIEAPGTYNHSVIVGTMAEAAASAVNANLLLAKVCGYYHDIGKLKQPLYFIENQSDGKNRHDKLAPSMSGLVIISHVKSGVELAKKYKLGVEIINTIKQHHGTSLITYFYEKAKQLKGKDSVNSADFRYPGPKPQTREIAIVMLADVVEAASRTLENPTSSRIKGLVQTLINKIFSDGQLDECELTLKDLNNIAKSFNQILNGIYHHRIEYPDSNPQTNGKSKNGSTGRQQANGGKNPPPAPRPKSENHLKRLGI